MFLFTFLLFVIVIVVKCLLSNKIEIWKISKSDHRQYLRRSAKLLAQNSNGTCKKICGGVAIHKYRELSAAGGARKALANEDSTGRLHSKTWVLTKARRLKLDCSLARLYTTCEKCLQPSGWRGNFTILVDLVAIAVDERRWVERAYYVVCHPVIVFHGADTETGPRIGLQL